MKFLLLPHIDENAWASLPTTEQQARIAAFGVYGRDLKQAEAFVGAYRPAPSATAKTVRVVDGEARVADGPRSATGDQLSGVYIIDVPDVDAAVGWAVRNPAAAFGLVEVRPLLDPGSRG